MASRPLYHSVTPVPGAFRPTSHRTLHITRYSAQQERSSNGAASFKSNGTDMRDVYIADVDMTRGSIGDGSRMSVPVDTTVDDTYDSITNSDSVALQLSRDNEALKTELRTVRMELSETAEQVQHLTVQLADKERSLQVAKADMIETRLELQRNQTELQEVQRRLKEVTNERSEYRQYLLEAQAELTEARNELLEWCDGLQELNAVVEGLDTDLADAFGEGVYGEAVAEALRLSESLSEGSMMHRRAQDDSSSIAAALQGLHELSAEVLRQAEEDRKLFGTA